MDDDDQTTETLDPAFVFDGAEPQTFWDNYAYFQSENQRKRQEFLEHLAQIPDDSA